MEKVSNLNVCGCTSISDFCFFDCMHLIRIAVLFNAGVVDGLNGITKTKITCASARQLKRADEGEDVKKLDPSVMKEGKAVSPAKECQRWLNLDGRHGAKSSGKSKKREENSEFKKWHFLVRDQSKKLSGLKCEAPVLPKGFRVSDFYNVCVCPEMGLERVATRRIPCLCAACKRTLKLGWRSGISLEMQPRFQKVQQCKLKSVLGDENGWFFPELKQRTRLDANWEEFTDDEADLMRSDLWEHLTAEMVSEIVLPMKKQMVTVWLNGFQSLLFARRGRSWWWRGNF